KSWLSDLLPPFRNSPLLGAQRGRKLNRQFLSSCSRTAMSQQQSRLRSWIWEWVEAALLLVLAVALVITSKRVPVSYQLGLWGIWIVVLGFLFRRGWIRLFGPVLFYDLVRTGRRTRNILLRCCYALALLFVLYTVYSEHAGNIENHLRDRNRYIGAGLD